MDKIAIIVNKKAKNAEQINPYITGFAEAKLDVQLFTTEPQDLDATIKNAIANYKIVLVGGGDGTIRTAAQHAAKTKTVIGVLPLGTLNHFSKELNVPTTIEEIVAALKAGSTQIIDLAEVNGLIFVNNSSIGFYPNFADKRDLYSKKYNKWLSYIPSFLESVIKHRAFSLELKSKDINRMLYTSFLMVSNNAYSYEFPITFKREHFNHAELGLYFFKQGRLRLLKLLKSYFSKPNNFEIHQVSGPIELHFRSIDEINISLDGDTMDVKTPLIYQSLPASLTVLSKSS